ncbi:recombination-associated protein RdgC [Desulfonatronospira sp.]|uniref:recombination-associated protein RdgC n=1 Tax=Desulfonatronospira sp. TaxID=1962951 RepID=UPI0025BA40E3|nr:recombination-associated protein RdgC [Desulfonatronospira sp.]
MGILSSSVSLTRYRIVEKVPDELVNELPQRLKSNAFREIDQTSDERSFGWVCFDDFLDNKWHTSSPHKGHYLAFALRLDTRRIPPAVMKKHLRLALEEARREQEPRGRKIVTRDQKAEIKDRVKQTLMGKTLPVPAVFDVVWDVSRHMIYLGSISPKVRQLFEDQFTQSFDLSLEPQTPYFLAAILAEEQKKNLLEEVEASVMA